MVKALSEGQLRSRFCSLILNTHYKYLRAISNLISGRLEKSNVYEDKCMCIISKLAEAGHLGEKKDDPEDIESEYFRNLRNAWYHEYAMNKSSMEIAVWKIIQSYYVVFCSISALVRCYYENMRSPGHKKMSNTYAKDFVINPSRNKFLVLPTNLYFKKNELYQLDAMICKDSLKHYVDDLENSFRWAKGQLKYGEKDIVTVPVYLRALREWVNYSDAFIFLMLYGPTIRDNLELFLKNVTMTYLIQTEYFMIQLFGLDSVNFQFRTFTEQLEKNLKAKSPDLETRFRIYNSRTT